MEPAAFQSNSILAGLPEAERDELLGAGTLIVLESGHTLLRPEDPYVGVFFPVTAVICAVGVLEEGQHVELAATGPEGIVGLGTVLDIERARNWLLVQIEGSAYQVPVNTFVRLFDKSPALRALVLRQVGRLLADVGRSAVCNRFHSHRERLARWLIVTMRKSGRTSFPLTHEFVAQMIGGPRHLVSAELAALRALGAVNYHRGEITIVDDVKLIAQSCSCVNQA